jgi:predicted aminopeptidase
MVLGLSGCQTIRFYGQAAVGQYQILTREKAVSQLIQDPATDARLKTQLELVLRLRQFAASELKLPPHNCYLEYADVGRPYVVWNVNVSPALSLAPKTWWFPVVGTASYRGYFSLDGANRYAAKWAGKGWDVYISDVPTYSTLGWFADPLLNTYIFEPEGDLADTIFHELTHRRLFISGDTDFNEAFATTVADEGVRRWFRASTNNAAYDRHREEGRRENDFVKLVMATRAKLHVVYGDASLSPDAKLRRKAEIIVGMRADYARLKESWGVTKSGYDVWFALPINNAQLNTVSAYNDLVPAFQALLRAQGGDLEKFYQAVASLGKLPLAQRHENLNAYLRQ